ncbi:MAG: PEP-CTERM sorting domain-containing protein [Cyanobacteriota bacterium]|nr:PEP-CTERM sorting domain-containing protein [Cyanobacteriota bacterium]
MTNKLQKLGIFATGLALSCGVINVNKAGASGFHSDVIDSTTTYDFDVDIYSGPLVDKTFDGFFSYKDSNVTGVGEEYVELEDFEFDLFGTKYTSETHSDLAAEVLLFDGELLGLDLVNDTFAFNPGFFELEESFFSYNLGQLEGSGDFNYSLRHPGQGDGDDNHESTPEPNTIIGLSVLGGSFLLKKVKSKK